MGETVAFFDVEGTLFAGNLWRAVVAHHRIQGVGRNAVRLYLAVHIPLWYLHRAGLLSRERAMRRWAQDMTWLMRGWPVERAARAFGWVVEQQIAPRLQPESVDALRSHQRQGHQTILISGGPEPLIQALGMRLGVASAIGTRWQTRAGCYTGRIIPPVCMGEGKAARLDEFLAGPGRVADLPSSYAYGDTLADVPMLERVGHPVAAYPQPALASLAAARGWPVIGEPVHADS